MIPVRQIPIPMKNNQILRFLFFCGDFASLRLWIPFFLVVTVVVCKIRGMGRRQIHNTLYGGSVQLQSLHALRWGIETSQFGRLRDQRTKKYPFKPKTQLASLLRGALSSLNAFVSVIKNKIIPFQKRNPYQQIRIPHTLTLPPSTCALLPKYSLATSSTKAWSLGLQISSPMRTTSALLM